MSLGAAALVPSSAFAGLTFAASIFGEGADIGERITALGLVAVLITFLTRTIASKLDKIEGVLGETRDASVKQSDKLDRMLESIERWQNRNEAITERLERLAVRTETAVQRSERWLEEFRAHNRRLGDLYRDEGPQPKERP